MSRKTITFLSVTVSFLLLGILLQAARISDLPHLSKAKLVYKETAFPVTDAVYGSLPAGSPLGLYLYGDPSDAEGRKAMANLETALSLAKLDHKEIGAEGIRELKPGPWTVLLLMGEDISRVDRAAVESFVRQGGRLVVGTRFYAPEWDRMLGIADNRGFREGAMHGIRFDKPLFPGYLDLPSNNVVFSNSVLDVQLAPESVPYLSSEGTPLLWTHVYGQGKVLFWNWTSSTQKLGRGLLVQSIGLASESFVSAQVASRSLNIDDFPSPVPDSDNPLVRQEYGLSTQDFYERVWWEDMTRFAKVYGWKYTGLLIGNYQNQTDSPLPALTDDYAETIPYFGTKLIGMGGELGLHGYNHQSLVTRGEPVDPDLGYRPWQSEPAMEEGLVHLNDLAKKLFPGHELKTYVPPSNVLNRTGKEALARAVPSLAILSSLYDADGQPGYLEQEFGRDAEFPQLFNFPRVSSGYAMDASIRFYIADVVANFGLVNHFVHPDDVLDAHRSQGKGWKALSEPFEKWMATLNQTYPYLQPLTVRDAVKKFSLYQDGRLEVRYSNGTIAIQARQELVPMHYTVRIPEGKRPEVAKEDGVLTRLEAGSGLWHLEARKPAVTIALKEGKP